MSQYCARVVLFARHVNTRHSSSACFHSADQQFRVSQLLSCLYLTFQGTVPVLNIGRTATFFYCNLKYTLKVVHRVEFDASITCADKLANRGDCCWSRGWVLANQPTQ